MHAKLIKSGTMCSRSGRWLCCVGRNMLHVSDMLLGEQDCPPVLLMRSALGH